MSKNDQLASDILKCHSSMNIKINELETLRDFHVRVKEIENDYISLSDAIYKYLKYVIHAVLITFFIMSFFGFCVLLIYEEQTSEVISNVLFGTVFITTLISIFSLRVFFNVRNKETLIHYEKEYNKYLTINYSIDYMIKYKSDIEKLFQPNVSNLEYHFILRKYNEIRILFSECFVETENKIINLKT